MNTWTPARVAHVLSRSMVGYEWKRLSAMAQRELFGAVILGRKEIRLSPLHYGIYWRATAGRDANGMPRYIEHFVHYRELADQLHRLNLKGQNQ